MEKESCLQQIGFGKKKKKIRISREQNECTLIILIELYAKLWTSWKVETTSSSLNRPALHILAKSSPPAAYSITIAKRVGVNNTWEQNVWACLSWPTTECSA